MKLLTLGQTAKMKQRLSALAIAGMSFSFVTQADAQNVTIEGAFPCNEWARYRADPTSVGSNIVEMWLTGMMSGMAFGSGKDFWANLNRGQVYFWMDRYCDNNPLSHTVEGASKLMVERHGRDWAAGN